MRVNLKWLKLHPMESEEFHLQAKGRDNFLKDIGGRFLEPIDVHLLMEYTGEIYIGRGKVRTELVLSCSRCLEEFNFPIDLDLNLTAGEYLIQGDEESIFIQDSEADIMPRIEAAIFSVIPLNPLCSQECQGLCPFCGVNRNLNKCNCKEQDIDSRWEKLNQLKE